MGDEDDGGGVLGKFGAAFGKGAAKYGKKAAQSEAGRRATSAAVKGACDGVRDDMISRYGSSSSTPPVSPTATTPTAAAAARKGSTDSSRKVSTVSSSSWKDDDDEGNVDDVEYKEYTASIYQPSVTGPPARRPPKPSVFDRLNFTRSKSSSSSSKQPPRRRVDPKNKVYKSRLAREPDWDRLPVAQAQYNYKGEMKCDLVFRKGQIIQVITRSETQNDWWEGKLDGRVGIFPANYVKLL